MKNLEINKVVVGQNVTITISDSINPVIKHTKRFTDKVEKTEFIAKIEELKTTISAARSEKIKNKHIDTLVNMFTANTKEVVKKEEAEAVALKSVNKKVEKENKKAKVAKLPSEMSLEELEALSRKNVEEGQELQKQINKLKGNESKLSSTVASTPNRRRGEY